MNKEINLRFWWSWIKDRQIIHVGNEYKGQLIIYSEDKNEIRIWEYVMISEE